MKIDINDKLFSQYKRQNQTLCQRCMKKLSLQCCHIFSRKYYSTRFYPDNAIVLCYSCHKWFDTHKITALLFDESKRVLDKEDESFTFLVNYCGYTWEKLEFLYKKSQEPFRGYRVKKKDITDKLKKMIIDNQ